MVKMYMLNDDEMRTLRIRTGCILYEAGQSVRIRPDLSTEYLYHNLDVNDEMVLNAGKFATITKINSTGRYEIDLDTNYIKWNYNDEMFVKFKSTKRKVVML